MGAPLLTEDFKEFLRSLNAVGVEYLLVGGYAVGLHGYPRATADLDIWIRPSESNAAKVLTVTRDFGFPTPVLREELFRNPDDLGNLP